MSQEPDAELRLSSASSLHFSAAAAVGYGWRKLQQNLRHGLMSIAVLTMSAFVVVPAAAIATRFQGFKPQWSSLSAGMFAALVSFVGLVLLAAIVRAGLDVTEGAPFNLASAARKLDWALVACSAAASSLLLGLAYGLLWIPGFLVAAMFTMFSSFFAVDGASSAVDAVRSSVDIVAANLGASLRFALVSILAMTAGLVALCIGAFVALPTLAIAGAFTYKTFTHQAVAP